MPLLLKQRLSRVVEQTETNALVSRLSAIQAMPGNPMEVEMKQYGQAIAFSAKQIPGPSFNKVKGLSDENIESLDDILNFYGEREIPFQFEITPNAASDSLFSAMAKRGLYQCGFHTSLYTETLAKESASLDKRIAIRELNGDEFSIFANLYIKGFGLPDFTQKGIEENNAILYGNERWKFYLALYNGQPAGVGVLFLHERIASLGAAAVIPEYRRKGIHQALIQKRLKFASEHQAVLAVSQAGFNSMSHENMERAGLGIAYTNAVWKKLL
ncbi:GNAT family N-acetyltransferase [Cytobacillus purgationiresistens]|uniref:GNAT superfamily N-acetyltransferase n=1 Tax=Cytobacillus purgationiresistens TaxID=863449 RepID=A0ABU0AJN3_9BACI|nr:GNAT family N-acetyltransferase [Cytobacillus purgationiresistens]MDQ0271469.1 GNAT superfamily N-acetyltransferase [Cytobacillus purgationiresistens]